MCLRIIALAKIHLPIHSDLSHCHEKKSLPLRWGRWRSSVSSLTLDSYFNAGREGWNLREGRGGEFAASPGSLALLGMLAFARQFLTTARREGKNREKLKSGGRLPLRWGRWRSLVGELKLD